MTVSSQRFAEELKRFMKENQYSSIDKAIDKNPRMGYRERISRIKSGKIRMSDEELEFFAELFDVREEYLSGVDDFRTDDELEKAIERERSMHKAFHRILLSLGYTDYEMDDEDFNYSFPPNTQAFIESTKQILNDEDCMVMCDVDADTYISIPKTYYMAFMNEILDFMRFKLKRMFSCADMIPTVVFDDDTTLAHVKNRILTTDGEEIEFQINYTPTPLLKKDTYNSLIEFETEES